MKGADVVMHNIVQYNDWMDEEVHTSLSISIIIVIVTIILVLRVVVEVIIIFDRTL